MSEDQLEIRYIPLDQAVLWDRNPKRHSIGDLDASFDRYGFKMPPRYEPHINGQGQGGIGAGNGRIKTLMMRRDQNRPPPRGILVRDDQWLVPILFGVDADSQAAAEAFGIDDNNLTLSGGDFTAFDMSRLWSADYTDILASLALSSSLPITVDGDGLLNRQGNQILSADDLWRGMPEFEHEDKTAFKSITLHFKDQSAVDEFARLVGQTISPHTRFLWYPYIEIETYADKRYAPES